MSTEVLDNYRSRSILVVDDEPSMRQMLSKMLGDMEEEVVTEERGEDAIDRLEAGERFKVVITDLKLPESDGLDVLERVESLDPACQVIVVTAHATADSAITALKEGAFDYIQKPFKVDQARLAVEKALKRYELTCENLYLRRELEERDRFGDLIGRSEPMQEVFERITRVAPTDSTVLLTGESGTGKELVARAIHSGGPDSGGPFRPISCGAVPENLIESELFGHERGAFTGADESNEGLFRAASGGTVFLDEVAEIPPDTQVKLLRVLQEEKVKPVGGNREIEIDCRVVAATNRDLREEVEAGRFREDLFFRLNVIPFELPPLRERREDIPLLIEHFIETHTDDEDPEIEGVESDAKSLLLNYSYPGNVRELENIVERAAALETGHLISTDVLPHHMKEESLERATRDLDVPEEGLDLEQMVEQLERELILKALDRADGVKKDAASLLEISFRSLRYRLDKYDIG